VRTAYAEFKHWYQTWDQAFSQKYEDAGMHLAGSTIPPTYRFVQRFTDRAYKSNSYMLNCTTVLLL